MTEPEQDLEKERAEKLAREIGGMLAIILGLRPRGRQRVEWDAARGRFRVGKRLVTIGTIRKVLDQLESKLGTRMTILAQNLENKTITVQDWTGEMKRLVGSAHVLNGALAAGSAKNAIAKKSVQERIASEREYVDGFANSVRKKKPRARSIAGRARSYLLAAATTYAVVEHGIRKALGFTEARRILRAKESCDDCYRYKYRWVPIELMPPIGSLECGSRCRCYLEYR